MQTNNGYKLHFKADVIKLRKICEDGNTDGRHSVSSGNRHLLLFWYLMKLCDDMIINWEEFIDQLITQAPVKAVNKKHEHDDVLLDIIESIIDPPKELAYKMPDINQDEKFVKKKGKLKVANMIVVEEWAILKGQLEGICHAHHDKVVATFSDYNGLENLRLILGERKPVCASETCDITRQEKSEISDVLRCVGKNLKLVRKCIVQIDEDMAELKHYGKSFHVEYLLKIKKMYAEKFLDLFIRTKKGVQAAAGFWVPMFAMPTEFNMSFFYRAMSVYLQDKEWMIIVENGRGFIKRNKSFQGWKFEVDKKTFEVPDSLFHAQRKKGSNGNSVFDSWSATK